MYLLGISAFYHDSAACLVQDGEIVAAAQEERFTRKKHDPGFPRRAVEYCLTQAGIGITDLKYVVFYDKPLIKYERLLETYLGFAPHGIQSFLTAMPVWMKGKLLLRNVLKKEVLACANGLHKSDLPEFLFGEHHESHAATRKELRQFGLLVGAIFTVMGVWPLVVRGEPVRLWAIGVGGLLIACGGMLPQLLAPIHTGWMWVGQVLGWINTRILLTIVFYGLVTPIGLVFRLMGKDTMRQRVDESGTTYRVVRSPRPPSHMKYQF